MPLDPKCQTLLQGMSGPQICSLSVDEARVYVAAMFAPLASKEAVGRIEERLVPGPLGDIPVRIYAPVNASESLPIVLFFHAGGWVLGSIETHDGFCRSLTNVSRCITVSVGYRLAPEHKYPGPFEDCFAVLGWTAREAESFGGDPTRIAVAGDSAGGNLAAAVALASVRRGGPTLLHQVLICPALDARCNTESYRECSEGCILTAADMRWYWKHYLASAADGESLFASPLRATDLRGLPPATVITCEYDPLRDEGDAYASRLREAKVPLRYKCYEGVVHGFTLLASILDQGKEALDYIGDSLRAAFARKESPAPT